MRNVWSIYKKELTSYFNSPVAYIVLTVFLLISGWFFAANFFLIGQATVRTVLVIIPWIFIAFVPALTMRSIAEEKKSGTIELLVTMPVKDQDVVLGKFLAALSLLAVALLFSLAYAFTASLFGNLDEGPTIGGYIGLLLVGAAYVAIGIFASSTSENQVNAFIIGLGIIFAFFMFDKVLIYVPPQLASILEYLSVDYHYNSLARGVIDTRDLVYYLSLTAFALVLATRSLESRKW
ncbi:MAG: ABC transporter [Candidatus Zixiibacteriota bacterium]|nr:MAG: ABC transporter [candidate division Zixibacteria bacterium]